MPTPSRRPDPLPHPWPRTAPDGTPLGVDLAAPSRHKGSATVADDVRRIVLKHFHPEGVDPDDLVGEVYAAISRKNRQGCAFDPRRAGLSKYVWRVAYGVHSNLRGAAKRWEEIVDPRAQCGDSEPGDEDAGGREAGAWMVAGSVWPDMETALDLARGPVPQRWEPDAVAPPEALPALWERALAERAYQRSRPGRRGQRALWAAWRLYPWRARRAPTARPKGPALRLVAGGPGQWEQAEMWTVVEATVRPRRGRARLAAVVDTRAA